MAATTTVLGLLKPAYSDDSDIGDINGNMDLIDAEAAKVRGNVAADYDSAQTYAVGDYCIHDGDLYKCNSTISSPEAWTAGHWTQIKIAGELATLNGKIDIIGVYDSGNSSNISVNNDTVTALKTINLSVNGAYLISARVDFATTSGTGFRSVSRTFSGSTTALQTTNGISGAWESLSASEIVTTGNTSAQYTINATQTSGATANVGYAYSVIRIK